MCTAEKIINENIKLCEKINNLNFSSKIDFIYNPLNYAFEGFKCYVNKFVHENLRGLFIGMNPGPFGMAQTGIPFGEINHVKFWLGIDNLKIYKPENESKNYPVNGLNCTKSEISGKRLWGLFREKFITPENFFNKYFVINYCPLMFIAGKNLTPDKLNINDRKILFEICDESLKNIVEILKPEFLIGVGKFAFERSEIAMKNKNKNKNIQVVKILHPSPASPLSVNWGEKVTEQLKNYGIWN